MKPAHRWLLLAVAILVAMALVVWFGLENHDAHSLLRTLRHAL